MDAEPSNKVGTSNTRAHEALFACCFKDLDYLIIKVLFI